MKATYKNTILAETDKPVVVEGNKYFPPESVKKEYFKKSSKTYTCPWKGDAEYYDIEVNGEILKDVAWVYPNPKDEAKEIAGHFAFEPSVTIE